MEDALQQSNQTLRSIVDSSPSAIIALDMEGRITLWNPAAEKIYGWNESEVMGKTPPLVPAHKKSEFLALNHRIQNGERFTSIELKRQTKQGAIQGKFVLTTVTATKRIFSHF